MMIAKHTKSLAVCLCLLACAPLATAQTCDPARITLAASSLGMDYRRLAAPPIAEILSQGEAEYLSNTTLVASGAIRANQKQRLWQKHVRALVAGQLPEYRDDFTQSNIYFFRLATPNMFQALRRCVNPEDPVLGYIAALPEFPEVIELNR